MGRKAYVPKNSDEEALCSYRQVTEDQAYKQSTLYRKSNLERKPTIIKKGETQFGPFPIKTFCYICEEYVLTATEYIPGRGRYLFACLLVSTAFIGICCLLPCIDSFKDVEHKCPNCGILLGIHKRMNFNKEEKQRK
ncbi:hypothetical protein B4U80_03117 [Leptotrombidium deliense]|uniref:LITAF domain-containing protein n=1 Tax=Leptotrombidium deliense TaxID=299467 RepID=A0A443S0B6_9ACAR|nr:hypothetical protein B4U80_03117 [Leptotrombidium deliense]